MPLSTSTSYIVCHQSASNPIKCSVCLGDYGVEKLTEIVLMNAVSFKNACVALYVCVHPHLLVPFQHLQQLQQTPSITKV